MNSGKGTKLHFEPLDAPLGARVTNLEIAETPDELTCEQVRAGLEEFGVLLVEGQEITPEEQVRFCRPFGELDLPPRFEDRQAENPEIFVIGNPSEKAVLFAPNDENGEPDARELEWHADHSQYAAPAWISMMYGVKVPPEGGDTLFACTYSAYEALDDTTKKKFEGVDLLHSVRGVNDFLRELGKADIISAAELELEQEPPQRWPLVRTHPRSGRKALYFGARMSIGAVGMTEQESHDLIRSVTEHTCRPQFVYRHKWRQGDVVLWDNRRVVHAATTFDTKRYKRVIHRTTVQENTPIR